MTAIDDFGAGYAGLNLLASLSPDLLKIDMQLLRNLHESRSKQAIISGIVSIARALDVVVLAEGVESAEELIVLRAAGISLFQGYYFARPLTGQLPKVTLASAPAQRGAM
jgi:EAL domain-containing protein (putative c-di-GMP-specific phosphodiesterase class I)